jgi:glycosyltransferase involved in cell wall biosynthesis
MLDLAQFRGLVGSPVAGVPSIVYFHENQLTYPQRLANDRDLHFAFTNFTTALAANQVWFNSAYHRDDFLAALAQWLVRMPDFAPLEQIEDIRGKSHVQSPGITTNRPVKSRSPGPLRVAWAARWEHDKSPGTFLEAVRILRISGVKFRLSLFGQSFKRKPPELHSARQDLSTHIDHWGFVESHQFFLEKMSHTDVFVSTAIHEFFGLAAMEAISLGLRPVLPQRLAYPELLGLAQNQDTPHSSPQSKGDRPVSDGSGGDKDTRGLNQGSCGDAEEEDTPCLEGFFYDGSAEGLAGRLAELAVRPDEILSDRQRNYLQGVAERYTWKRRAAEMDEALERVACDC